MQNANLDEYNIALELTKSYFKGINVDILLSENPEKSVLDLWNDTYNSFFNNIKKKKSEESHLN